MSMAGLADNLKFRVEIKWDGKAGALMSTGSGNILSIDTPKDFGGFGAAPCPDELFIASISGCILTTFLWFIRKRGVQIVDMRLEAETEIELVKGAYSIKGIKIKAQIRASREQAEGAKKCLDLAIRYCHISRSIERCVPVEIAGEVIIS
ncbi:MAG TPA: OsmC family peroxiredoxin [Candidatus Korarchaeota archaeon]|nr:OsmC family peroxiredoxin [Candidatus Korarchaeota archaeon]